MKTFLLLIIIMACSAIGDYYIRSDALGDGSGSDWTNAFTSLPNVLIRGERYWIGGGNYGTYSFDDPEVGTDTIWIIKANVENHGTDIGWVDSLGIKPYIVDTSKTIWKFSRGYYYIDGQTGYSNDTLTYGIKLHNSNNSRNLGDGLCVHLPFGNPIVNNITFKHIDVNGAGTGIQLSPDSGLTRLFLFSDTINGLIIQNCLFRNAGKVWISTASLGRNCLIENCYFDKNGSNVTSEHCNGINLYGIYNDMNCIVRNNVFRDMVRIGATNYIQIGHYSIDYPSGQYYIYGNVFIETETTSGTSYPIGGIGDPLISNSIIFNNTFINLFYLNFGTFHSVDNVVMTNNLLYNCTNNNTNGVTSVNNKDVSVLEDIFIDMNSNNFALKISVGGATDLSGVYGEIIDPNGVVRGVDNIWDYGAYEFNNNDSLVPVPFHNSKHFRAYNRSINPLCTLGIWKSWCYMDTSSNEIGVYGKWDSILVNPNQPINLTGKKGKFNKIRTRTTR